MIFFNQQKYNFQAYYLNLIKFISLTYIKKGVSLYFALIINAQMEFFFYIYKDDIKFANSNIRKNFGGKMCEFER